MKVLLLCLFLLSCSQPKPSKKGTFQGARDYEVLVKYEDHINDVICYRLKGYECLSCIKTRESK